MNGHKTELSHKDLHTYYSVGALQKISSGHSIFSGKELTLSLLEQQSWTAMPLFENITDEYDLNALYKACISKWEYGGKIWEKH